MTQPCPRCGEPLSEYRQSRLVTRLDCANGCNEAPSVLASVKETLGVGASI